MSLRSAVFPVILGLLLALAAPPPVLGQNLTASELKQSDIIFVGTVVNVGATSFKGFPASQNTLIVRADAVLEKPPGVVLRPGDNLTVVAKDASELKKGIHGTFYTAGWVYGDGIAVREIGHELPADLADPPDAAQKKEENMQARKAISDADLKARIDSAGLVIVGRVEEVRPPSMATAAPSAAPITEHDPEWKEAIIHADSIIKGPASSAKEIVVHFPASIDVSWYEWPKLKVGQEGTFILQDDKVSGAPAAMLQKKQVRAYITPNTEDVLSKEDAVRVRALTTK